jgi:hypothetical protein
MSDTVILRSIVNLVWYPEVRSVTADAFDAVIESVDEGETSPPPFAEDDHARPLNWIDQIKLIFEAAGFVKTCIEVYNISPTYEEARSKIEKLSASMSDAVKSRTAKVTAAIESWTRDDAKKD